MDLSNTIPIPLKISQQKCLFAINRSDLAQKLSYSPVKSNKTWEELMILYLQVLDLQSVKKVNIGLNYVKTLLEAE